MNTRVTIQAHDFDAVTAAEANQMFHSPIQAAMPAPTQFAAVTDLIKSVFHVPSVSVDLQGGPVTTEAVGYRSFLEIPLVRHEDVIGSLRLHDTIERKFSEQDHILLQGFARLVVDQVDLWAEASRDSLTGAMTRRAFSDSMRRAFAARMRLQNDASLVLFDLDYFKTVNDTWGHSAGDAVLRAVGRAVQRELRVEDSFGRVGGEEFAIIVANADAHSASEVAERVRNAIERIAVPGHEHIKVTASFGIAEATNADADVDTWSTRADEQLYAAKHEGRNRVNVAPVEASRLAMMN